MHTAEQSLQKLIEGNNRFSKNYQKGLKINKTFKFDQSLLKQNPCAIILSCSDSRVPPEIIFDQGIGDLFIVRIAGNTISKSQLSSIEFATVAFSIPLIIVLGHSACGAVSIALENYHNPKLHTNDYEKNIIEKIQPIICPIIEKEKQLSEQSLNLAIRENVKNSVQKLQHCSEIISKKSQENKLMVKGAYYNIQTGKVEFIEI